MLGQGMYDVAEVVRLLAHRPDQVVRWASPTAAGPAIAVPTFEKFFSFVDLVSLRVATKIREAGVPDRHLRQGLEWLRTETQSRRPLAERAIIASLATSGSSFVSSFGTGEYHDIGRGGQGAFQNVLEIHLTRISFDVAGAAERWTPAEGVVLDPRIQAGAPCVAGTRVPTEMLFALLAEVHASEVATDYCLTVEQVEQARRFEAQLRAGVALAA